MLQLQQRRNSLFRQAIATVGILALCCAGLSCSKAPQEPESRLSSAKSSTLEASADSSSADNVRLSEIEMGKIELGEIARLNKYDFTTIVADEIAKVDPGVDGWQTEEFSDAAMAQLKLLGKLLSHPDSSNGESQIALADEKFASSPLRPGDLQTAFEDSLLMVMRPGSKVPQSSTPSELVGPKKLGELLRELRAPFLADQDVRTKFKVVGVDLSDASATTTVYYQAASGQVSQTATWECRWHLENNRPPKLLHIEVSSYEESYYQGPNDALFSDCTEAVLSADKSYQEHLRHSLDFWRARLDASLGTGLASYVVTLGSPWGT